MHGTASPRRLVDLRVFGAATLPDRELVRLVCGPRIDDADVTTVTAALAASVAPEVVMTMELAPGAEMGVRLAPPDTAPVGLGLVAKKLAG